MPSSSPRGSLPFEPRSKKPKNTKKKDSQSSQPSKTAVRNSKETTLNTIPDQVSKRMVRRMALFCGVPTILGMSSFGVSYLVVTQGWFELPPYAVLAVSLGLFGLGVLGLSYGIFSTSWDEDRIGGWWGWQEFKMNLGRTLDAWRSERQKAKEN